MARKASAGHAALRESEHRTDSPEPTHHVVAVSPSGEELWTTESYYTHDRERPQTRFADDYAAFTGGVIDGQEVDRFELKEA